MLVCDQASLFQSQDERAQKRAQQQAKQAAQKAFLGTAPAVLTRRHIHMARLMRIGNHSRLSSEEQIRLKQERQRAERERDAAYSAKVLYGA